MSVDQRSFGALAKEGIASMRGRIPMGRLPATVANIETGQHRVDVIELIALANALALSPQNLFQQVVNNVDADELVGNSSRSKKERAGGQKVIDE